eukprot:7911016-Lingulodinium_polyedra.AAC.1
MSFAKKCARVHLRCAELAFRCGLAFRMGVYHYDAEDITARHRELATDAVVYGQVLNRAQAKPPVAVSPAAALCVSYFKARFDTHFIYSMPADLWALVVAAEGADVQQLDACQLLGAMQDDPLALDT